MSHNFLSPGDWNDPRTSTPPGRVFKGPSKNSSKDSSRESSRSRESSGGSSGGTSNAEELDQADRAAIASTRGDTYPGFSLKASARMVKTKHASKCEMGVKLSLHHAGEMRHHHLTNEWYDASELESMSKAARAATTYLEGAKDSYEECKQIA